MQEKLLSIKEVAECLKISEEEVKRLVDVGEIPAYKIGDTFLRFRKEQIDAVKKEIIDFESKDTEGAKVLPETGLKSVHPYTESRQYDYTPAEKVKDFFYFHDFYIASFIIIIFLIYLIFKS